MTLTPYPYTAAAEDALVQVLSTDRFATYLARADGDRTNALRWYMWNAAVSATLHGPLHLLEVTLRNAVHDRLAQHRSPMWFDLPDPLRAPEAQQVSEARGYLVERAEAPTAGKIVAELSFRFWVGMFSRKYDRLWTSELATIFHPRPIRHELHTKLDRLRTLRNRIAHHEPILQRHLSRDLADIREIVGALSSEALDWLDWHERATAQLGVAPGDVDHF